MSKPCIRYPSESAAIADLMAQNKSDQFIHAATGASMKNIHQVRSRLKRGLAVIKYAYVKADISAVRNLKLYAEARGVSTSELASRLLTEAVRGDLVDAVLDDGVTRE